MNKIFFKKKSLCCGLMLAALLNFALASFAADKVPAKAEAKLAAAQALLVAADNQFGLDILRILHRKAGPTQNVVVSPLGIALVLHMAYNGAAGNTKKMLANRLGLDLLPLAAVNQANQALAHQLSTASPDNQLYIANSLWVRPDVKPDKNFVTRLKDFYRSAVYPLPVEHADAAKLINAWVKHNTQGKIPKLIDTIDPNTTFLLINALYFHGSWAQAFDPIKTINTVFYQENNLTKPVAMMQRQGEWHYLENTYFQAVQLPYSDNNLTMFVFLPKPALGLAGLLSYFTLENWQTWQHQFQQQPGQVALPRFAIAYESWLKPILSELGMREMFDPHRANFTKMLAKGHLINLFIDDVYHKTWLEVNETGTTAAAVTATIMKTTALAEPVKPFNLRVDRPFLCIISDKETGAILFVGAIKNLNHFT